MPNENVTTKFKVDISDLKKNIAEANKQIRLARAEFKNATAGTDDWSKSADGLTAKIQAQNKIIEAEKTKLNALKSQLDRLNQSQEKGQQIISDLTAKYNDAVSTYGETSNEAKKYAKQLADAQVAQERNAAAADDLNLKILNQDTAVKNAESELNKYKNSLANLESGSDNATDATEDLEQSIIDADDAAQKASDGGFTVMKGALANLASEAIMSAVNALKELGGALIDVGKQAIANYADYEQLTGGIETLFGAGGQSVEEYAKSVGKSVDEVQGEYDKLISAQDEVFKNADNAYKTAGMSANEYMQNVTSFSASLISSLGGDTEKAAAAADQAMTDISDNANKMGTDMQSIVDTYQSLARGNYQMLDNLKLGYGGTKEEMQRLIDDANRVKEANGEMADLSIDSFADITEAIHVIQGEMGITGTTAKEASTTISGSVGSMQAAWQNLLTGVADGDADFGSLIDNFVESLLTVGDNLIPVVEKVIDGVTKLVTQLIERLFPEVVKIITNNAPSIINSIMNLISTVAQSLLDSLPEIVTTLTTIISDILKALSSTVLSCRRISPSSSFTHVGT